MNKFNPLLKLCFVEYFLPALCLLLTFSSCEEDISDPTKNSCKVTEVQNSFPTSTNLEKRFFSFDNNNRVKQVDSLKAEAGDYLTYLYDTQKIQVKGVGFYDANYGGTYTLSNNRVSKYTNLYSTRDFSYDAEGYLVKTVMTLGSYTETYSFFYSNGNLTKVEFKPPNFPLRVYTIIHGSEPYQNVLGYDNALLAADNVFLGEAADNVIISGGFFGKASKNLVAGVIFPFTQGAVQFTYEKDSDGKLSSIKKTFPDGSSRKMTLVYLCK